MASRKTQNTVSIGGDAQGNVIVAGENITVGNVQTNVGLPAPESVNLQKEIAALREILAKLETPDKGKMERALTDAQEEAAKPKPDKNEVGGALERVMKYAQKAGTFGKIVEELKPHAGRIRMAGKQLASYGENGGDVIRQNRKQILSDYAVANPTYDSATIIQLKQNVISD